MKHKTACRLALVLPLCASAYLLVAARGHLRRAEANRRECAACAHTMESLAPYLAQVRAYETAKARLDMMTKTNDGFAIAEFDLKQRGPGDFFGKRQHGLPELKIADLLEDMDTLKQAKHAALDVLAGDRRLEKPEHRALRRAVKELFSQNGESALN